MKNLTFFFAILFLFSCANPNKEKVTLHVIHAGSLTMPVKELVRAFEKENPEVEILTEAWGSKAGARKIIEVNTPADVFMSADYMVIENILIPDHAQWYAPFATNELALVYTEQSRFSDEINAQNWTDILMREQVKYGRSNPDMDPCGVRSVLAIKLAELSSQRDGLAEKMLEKDQDNIRPKETDLIALLESNHIDYIFLYKSVAVQHGLEYLELPDSINLGNFALNDWYEKVSLETLGATPGSSVTERGEAMVYALTIPTKSEQKQMAEKFAAFVLHPEKGQRILKNQGQDPVVNFTNPYQNLLPQSLREH